MQQVRIISILTSGSIFHILTEVHHNLRAVFAQWKVAGHSKSREEEHLLLSAVQGPPRVHEQTPSYISFENEYRIVLCSVNHSAGGNNVVRVGPFFKRQNNR